VTSASVRAERRRAARSVELVLRFRELGIAAVLVLVAAGLTGYSSHFLAGSNVRSILLDVTLLAVLGLGQTIVLLTRNLDLSVGSVVGLSAMSVGLIYKAYPDVPVGWAFAIGIVVGLVPGLVNGLVIAFARVPSIIFTLGMLSVLRGLVYLISHNRQINADEVPAGLASVSDTTPVGVPGSTFIALGLALATAAVAPVSAGAAAALAWLNGWCAAYLAAVARVVGGLPIAQIQSTRALLALLAGTFLVAAYASGGRELRASRSPRLE
jgi:rhamnose transport system permease protein